MENKAHALAAGTFVLVVAALLLSLATWLSRDIANKIENELTYPGQIKVTVIRETRSIEYAK